MILKHSWKEKGRPMRMFLEAWDDEVSLCIGWLALRLLPFFFVIYYYLLKNILKHFIKFRKHCDSGDNQETCLSAEEYDDAVSSQGINYLF